MLTFWVWAPVVLFTFALVWVGVWAYRVGWQNSQYWFRADLAARRARRELDRGRWGSSGLG